MSALGAMMLSEKGAKAVMGIVKADDFYRPCHRTLFDAMKHLWNRGVPPDFVTLPNRLAETGQLDETGGLEYVIQVAEAVPSAHNADHYAQIVADMALLRRIEEFGEDCRALAREQETEPADKLAKVQSQAMSLGRGTKRAIDISELDWESAPEGVPSGIISIDSNTESKGWPKGQLSVVAARKKVGKTSALCQFARNALRLSKRVLYVTLADLTKGQVLRRMVRQETGWAERPYDLMLAAEWDAKVRAIKELEWDLKLAGGKETGGANIEDVVPFVEMSVYDDKHDLVIIDYFQKLDSRAERDKVRALGKASQALAYLAESSGAAILVGSQLSNNRMTAWSQALEDDCGVLLDLDKEDDQGTSVQAQLKFNRWGPAGSFDMIWDKQKLVFSE